MTPITTTADLETFCAKVLGGRAEAALELNNLESVVFIRKEKKRVSFAAKVQCRPIPADNEGRKCKG